MRAGRWLIQACPHPDFPLLEIRDSRPVMMRTSPVKGAHGLAVRGDRVAFFGGYEGDAGRLVLCTLTGTAAEAVSYGRLVRPDGAEPGRRRVLCRGPRIHVQDEPFTDWCVFELAQPRYPHDRAFSTMAYMTGSGTRTDGRVERGNQTRRLVLERTMNVASVEGLEGLSLGRIATELKLSKSGVFALFGSKEELQLATVRAAVAVFAGHVVRPTRELPPGVARVWALCRQWLDYSARRVFAGGCFFYTVTAEFDARSGPVHDAVAKARTDWVAHVEGTIEEARLTGGFGAELDVPQLAFEIIALMEAANAESVLHDDDSAYDKAGRGILSRLRAAAADPAELPERP